MIRWLITDEVCVGWQSDGQRYKLLLAAAAKTLLNRGLGTKRRSTMSVLEMMRMVKMIKDSGSSKSIDHQ